MLKGAKVLILKKKRREIVLFLDLIILILVSILFYMIFPNNVSLANQNYYSLT
jgi:competence protein ComGC